MSSDKTSMELKNKILSIVHSYDFKTIEDNWKKYKYSPMGIGDILNVFKFAKENIISKPIYFPVCMFFSKKIYEDGVSYIEFRLKLIYDLMKSNNFDKNDFIIVIPNNSITELINLDIQVILPYLIGTFGGTFTKYYLKCDSLTLDFNNLNKRIIPVKLQNIKYIVFHTKLRFHKNFEYKLLKDLLSIFFKKFKTTYCIVLLGERVFGNTNEGNELGITTMYDELINLKNNNNVIDLTIDTIINNLNYENYIKDVAIIKYADVNLCCGLGGTLCTSLAFARKIVMFYKDNSFSLGHFNNTEHYDTIYEYLDYINNLYGTGEKIELPKEAIFITRNKSDKTPESIKRRTPVRNFLLKKKIIN